MEIWVPCSIPFYFLINYATNVNKFNKEMDINTQDLIGK